MKSKQINKTETDSDIKNKLMTAREDWGRKVGRRVKQVKGINRYKLLVIKKISQGL